MKPRITAFILFALIMMLGILPISSFAAQNNDDIIILYENDVHCATEGYSKLSAMKKELMETYEHVGVVSCGDFIQGGSLGIISKGEYIVNIMNLVGYDAIALGNHEFDYHLSRLQELVGIMNTKPVCCNFQIIAENTSHFEPYSIVSYGDIDIAYIGITTPSTIKSSSPVQFKDENGEYIFTFNPTTIYDVVQKNIDSAKADGADYIIALAHIGYVKETSYESSHKNNDIVALIENTNGLDVVLDGHSHSVIEGERITDKGGNEVLLSSTGTKFENIGKLTISNDTFKTELIKTESYPSTDPAVDSYLDQIETEYLVLGNRKVAVSNVHLITHAEDGTRLTRNSETNLGDLCSEAFRSAVDADIGYINGGGMRSDIPAGDITFNHLLNVLPYNNTIVLAEIDGQTFKDMLEMAMMNWPLEGSFPHVSGVTFSLNTSIPSSVILNETEEFCGVSGQYRVYNIKVFNKDTQKYEPIELTKTYTIASHNYYLIEHGSGMKMLENAKVIQNDGVLDVEALERYIVQDLNGVIDETYRVVKRNITFTDGELDTSDNTNIVLRIIGTAVEVVVIVTLIIIIYKKIKKGNTPKSDTNTL